jgi:hypothetical protein
MLPGVLASLDTVGEVECRYWLISPDYPGCMVTSRLVDRVDRGQRTGQRIKSVG